MAHKLRLTLALLTAALLVTPAAARAAGNAAASASSTGVRDTKAELLRTRAVLMDALKTDPDNSALWEHLGWTNKELDDVDGAQTAFEKVTTLNPKNAGAWSVLALIYEKKKMKDAASSAWKNCLSNATDAHLKEMAQQHLNHLQS